MDEQLHLDAANGQLPRVTLSQLRVLLAVARTGNLTRAAADLGTTQPAVSHSLRGLERQLGVAVLVRRRDGAALTPIGRAVSDRATVIFSQLEGIRQEAAVARGHAQGRLRLGVIPSVNARLLPGLLGRFSAAYDRVDVTVLEGSDSEVLEWLRTGAVDVATVTATAPDIATTPLTSDQMLAVLPAGHRLATKPSIGIGDLATEHFVMSTGGCQTLIEAIARRAGLLVQAKYQVRDTNSILAMVTERLGVTIMPELAIPAHGAEICTIPLEPAERRTILLALPADGTSLPMATAFVDLACHDVARPCSVPAESGRVRHQRTDAGTRQ